MRLYNTQSRKIEELIPIAGNSINMYVCGPTVYDHAHIGNLRTYLNEDFLRRALEYIGYEVTEVMNITDIEDKIINAANRSGVNFREITIRFEKAFLKNLSELNIKKPTSMPRATEEIDSMIKIIEELLKKKIAYKSVDNSVYFSISKFENYGKLSQLDSSGLKIGARVSQDEYDKDNARDFVIWKSRKENEPSWVAPFGDGRPGWHIECSAMSMKYLAETIDIHAGAVDLIFPHHENEIALSEAYSGKQFVRYWFHPEHLLVDNQRMGKSMGNTYKLKDIINKYNVEALAFRMLCLMSNYREKLNFTGKSIIQAQKTLNNLRHFTTRIDQLTARKDNVGLSKEINIAKNNFESAINNNLNMPEAMSALFYLIKKVNKISTQGLTRKEAVLVLDTISDFDKILGLDLIQNKDLSNNNELNSLLDKRLKARMAKDWVSSDTIRKKIIKLGFDVEDTKNGQILTESNSSTKNINSDSNKII